MAEMRFHRSEQSGMIFNGKFLHEDFSGAKTMFRVTLIPECDEGFWPWSDCSVDEDDVRDAKEVIGYRDEGSTPDDYFRFKIKRTNTEEDGDCVILTYQWKMWAGIIPVVDGAGGVETPIGTVTASGGFLPDKSGEFLIKVCCDDECNATATMLGVPPESEQTEEEPG